jgi:glycerophosphoryl diester phosphodiesterase
MKRLFFLGFFLLFACQPEPPEQSSEDQNNTQIDMKTIDWQGHRGARGLVPENTIPAFLKALTFPAVQTLELDVVISRDRQVVVSHEPWMSPVICVQPDGQEIPGGDEEPAFKIMQMPYEEIAAFNCGKVHPQFPSQNAMETNKPLLTNVIQVVKEYCDRMSRPMPYFNIEIKSRPEWDGVFTPEPSVFAELVLEVIRGQGVEAQTCIQSFDARSLEEVHRQAPEITTAYLVERTGRVERRLNELSFTPDIYSPYYRLVNKRMIETLHARDIRVIPWTVNDRNVMRELISQGVDGIITDYPNLIPEQSL